MLYFLYTKIVDGAETLYTMHETHTESRMTGDINCIKRWIKSCKMELKNMRITDKGMQTKQWPHDITVPYSERCVYMLLTEVEAGCFKILRIFDGGIVYMDEKELKENIKFNKVANCLVEQGAAKIYKSIDTYKINADNRFRQYIDKKYEEFVAKSLMLGLNISFEYTIENREVKIIKYTGKSSRAILPSFITTITEMAFITRGLRELKLNEGLKYIGRKAFAYNSIKSVIIPRTVVFVGESAFERNLDLVLPSGEYRDTVIKSNDKTVLM